jgi:hypothetical protein
MERIILYGDRNNADVFQILKGLNHKLIKNVELNQKGDLLVSTKRFKYFVAFLKQKNENIIRVVPRNQVLAILVLVSLVFLFTWIGLCVNYFMKEDSLSDNTLLQLGPLVVDVAFMFILGIIAMVQQTKGTAIALAISLISREAPIKKVEATTGPSA